MSLLQLIDNDLKETIKVKFKNKRLEVVIQPLTVRNIVFLLEKHTTEMADLLSGNADIFKTIADKAPDFMGDFISLGIEEDVPKDKIEQLPFEIQCRLSESIWNLSVTDGEYLGKLVGRLTKGLATAARMMPNQVDEEKIKKMLEDSRKELEKTGQSSLEKSSKASLPTDTEKVK